MKLCVFGADGATGEHLVRQALERGWSVVASVHDMPDDPIPGDVTYRTANVLEDDLGPVVAGCDAVCSALGVGNDPATLLDPPPLYTEGTANIVKAMRGADITRLVVISASFVEAKDRGPLHFRIPAMTGLARVFAQMEDMEAMLRATDDIEWTAVRPGWLMEGERTGTATVQPGVIPESMIRTRHGDLAALMLDCIADKSWIRQTPAIARPEDDDATSIEAVADEMLG